MKGRYDGCIMNVYSTIPGYDRLASIPRLSKKARQRLKWFDYYYSRGQNSRLSCRHFDISPQSFYRWKKRYSPGRLESLENYSHRPKHLGQLGYSVEQVEAVLRLREEYRRWGKEKLTVLLHREGFACSTSTVGRILHKAKERGVLKQPVPNHISAKKKAMATSLCSKEA